MVRNWRNDPEVSRYMIFRDFITSEQQERWFLKVQSEKSFYFIIVVENNEVGLTELKNFSADGKSAESGMFIYDVLYRDSVYGYTVGCLLLDFAFDVVGISEVRAQVLDENKRAVRFNESLGFVKVNADVARGKSDYALSAQRYRDRVGRFRQALERSLKHQVGLGRSSR
jgi:UDP-4-amino-4,6-dideoxy-N-acetyl-beta-L-altrosamine N-acetyltransferase